MHKSSGPVGVAAAACMVAVASAAVGTWAGVPAAAYTAATMYIQNSTWVGRHMHKWSDKMSGERK